MNEKEAREIADRWLSDLMVSRDDEFLDYLSKEIMKIHLEAIEKAKALVDALKDIAKFHDKPVEEHDKKYGFTGWTCCGQKGAIAKKAIAQWEKEK